MRESVGPVTITEIPHNTAVRFRFGYMIPVAFRKQIMR